MLPVRDLSYRLPDRLDLRGDFLLVYGGNAPKPGHSVRPMAADLRRRRAGHLRHEALQEEPRRPVPAQRGDHRRCGVHYRLDRDPLLRYAPVGLPGTILEYQRDHLRPQCGQLRPAGAGVPLSDRAIHGARDGQAEQEGGLRGMRNACGAAPDGLYSERTLSDAHYILRKKP